MFMKRVISYRLLSTNANDKDIQDSLSQHVYVFLSTHTGDKHHTSE